jgi:hypothetical protein
MAIAKTMLFVGMFEFSCAQIIHTASGQIEVCQYHMLAGILAMLIYFAFKPAVSTDNVSANYAGPTTEGVLDARADPQAGGINPNRR